MKKVKFVVCFSILAPCAFAATGALSVAEWRKAGDQALNKKQYAAVREACAVVRAATNATVKDVAWAFERQADVLAAEGKAQEAAAIYRDLMQRGGEPVNLARKAIALAKGREKFRVAGQMIGENWRYQLSDKQKSQIWDKYAYEGYLQMDPVKMWQGREESLKLGGIGGDYTGRIIEAKDCWDDLKTFPIDEKDIRWPATIEDFGVKVTKTVTVSKDFGFDPVNATDFLQAALTSGAQRVIVDNVGKPWYTRQLKVPSNVEVVFKKGVRMHTDRTWKEFKKGGLFLIQCVSNVVLRGEEPNDRDVVLSQFHDLADRCRNCRNYGRSGITMNSSKNVCVKNMRVAEMAEDALMFGGLWSLNRNLYFENLDLDSCFRQACSLCNDDRAFFRRVRFRGTAGAEPGAGIDLEPAEICQGNASTYLFDCTFEDNLGGGLLFSTSSYLPITLHAKRCTFEPHRNGDLMVFIRIGCYLGNGMKVPGKAIFEDCTFKGYSDLSPIRVDGISLLDLQFKNCVVKDTGKLLQRDGKRDASAISFHLNRDVYYEGHEKGYPEATIDFGNLRIEGYTNAAPIVHRNLAGHTTIRNLRGTIDFNGKKINAGKFTCSGPDNAFKDIPQTLPALAAAQAVPAPKAYEPKSAFTWEGSWWQARPQISYCFFGEKGKTATLVFNFPNQIWWRKEIVVTPMGGTASVSSADGTEPVPPVKADGTEPVPPVKADGTEPVPPVKADGTEPVPPVKADGTEPVPPVKLGEFKQGDNPVVFTFPETGWYAIEPVANHRLVKVEGTTVIYSTALGKFRDVQFDAPLGYVGYFEVPAKGEAVLKVQSGSLEIRDASGALATTCAASPRTGAAYAKLKSKSGKSEVWSFTLYDRASVKFFAPFTGFWADSPEAVPSAPDAIRTSAVKLVSHKTDDGAPVATADVAAILKANPVLAKIVKDEEARLAAWAKKGEFAELAKAERATLERMRKGPMNEQVQKEIADETKNLPPLELLEAQEARVRKMSAKELERYAFVNVFCVLKGFYQDKTFAQPFMRCKYEGAEMSRTYKDIYWCIYKKDFEDYIRSWLKEFKLDYADFTLVCDDDKKLDRLIPILETYARQSIPGDLK